MIITHILPKNKVGLIRQPIEMYLADLIVRYPEDYEVVCGPSKSYKIVDNSYNELGRSVTLDRLVKAAEIIEADEVILPDRESASEYINHLQHDINFLKHNCKKDVNLMAVVHAADWSEALNQIALFSLYPDIDTIGLPKPIAEIAPFSTGRIQAAKMIKSITSKNVHFLGSELLLEEITGRDVSNVRSMDTGYFISEAGADRFILEKREPGCRINLLNSELSNDFITARINEVDKFMKGWVN